MIYSHLLCKICTAKMQKGYCFISLMWYYSTVIKNNLLEDTKMKKILSLIVALTLVFALGASAFAADSDLAYVKDKGVLIVGITDFAPMDYKDEDGNWIGFDADMANAFGEYLDVDVEFIEIDWDNKILELKNKSIDCVWNGMTLTPEVLNAMNCSNPYCNNAQVVVVKAEVADDYQTVESLSELNFAVEAGSAGEAAVIDLGLEPTAVQTQADALMEVQAGTSDACVIDLLMAGAMIGEGTDYEELAYTVELTSEEYGVGFRTDSDLADELNAFFKAAYEDGSMLEVAKLYGVQESLVEQE